MIAGPAANPDFTAPPTANDLSCDFRKRIVSVMILCDMDVSAAQALAQRLADGATGLDLLRASIETTLNTVLWEGPDAAAFQSDWLRRHSSTLARASALL